MKKFDFNCPQCGKPYRCADRESGNVFQCPDCGHYFVPADVQHKNCPFCGKEILARAVKCRYCRKFLKKRRGRLVSPGTALTVLLLCALLGGGVFGWKKYSGFKEEWKRAYQEKLRIEARRQKEERRRAELEAQRNARQDQMIEDGKRRAAEEAKKRKEREEAEASRQQQETKEREEAEASRQRREAEQKAQREREESEQKAQRERAEAEQKAKEEEARRKAKLLAEKNVPQLRLERNHLQNLQSKLKHKKQDLVRAHKREKDSYDICQRKIAKGKHKYQCDCDGPYTWEFYRTIKAACCKAYVAAVIQRRKLEEEIDQLTAEIDATERKIQELESNIPQEK